MNRNKGRKLDPVWKHFEKDDETNRASCKHCGDTMAGLVARLKIHINTKCKKLPNENRVVEGKL